MFFIKKKHLFQLFEEPAKTLSGKVKLYLSDIWNKFDLLIITLLATAFVFKNFRETFWVRLFLQKMSC